MVSIQRMTLAVALHEWIKDRERIEREQWKYTMDSGQLAAIRELLRGVQAGEIVSLEGECT
jgi:hypothetical protein